MTRSTRPARAATAACERCERVRRSSPPAQGSGWVGGSFPAAASGRAGRCCAVARQPPPSPGCASLRQSPGAVDAPARAGSGGGRIPRAGAVRAGGRASVGAPSRSAASGAIACGHSNAGRVAAKLGAKDARSRSSTSASASAYASTSPGGTARPSPRSSTSSASASPRVRDDRQAGPEAVEQPGAEGEAGLDLVEVRRDADVRLEEVRAALVVRHPAVVEEDARSSTPSSSGQRERPASASPSAAPRRSGCCSPEEEEPELGPASQPVHGADHGQRIEPVPDPAAPEQRPVVRADPGHDAVQHRAAVRGGSGSMPNGTTSTRLRNDGSRAYASAVDPSGVEQRAEPEVALPLAGADERVAASRARRAASAGRARPPGAGRGSAARAPHARSSAVRRGRRRLGWPSARARSIVGTGRRCATTASRLRGEPRHAAGVPRVVDHDLEPAPPGRSRRGRRASRRSPAGELARRTRGSGSRARPSLDPTWSLETTRTRRHRASNRSRCLCSGAPRRRSLLISGSSRPQRRERAARSRCGCRGSRSSSPARTRAAAGRAGT